MSLVGRADTADSSADSSELKFLPSEQKKDLCLTLLTEFGVSNVRTAGAELRHNCTLPYGGHSDNNSYAASVNFESMQFNCYVCGFGGSVAWWIAANRGEDVDKVEPWLKAKLGLGSSLPLGDLYKVIDDILHPPAHKKILPKYPEKILERWTSWGMHHPYMTEIRHIPEENLERFRIGYADEDEDFHYHQRIVIPVFWRGSLVGWQARALVGPPDDPYGMTKYLNSLEFPRDYVLYGDVPEKTSHVVVVESSMSVLRHCHLTPIVATLGSNPSDAQLKLLERFPRVTLFNENDKAGWKMSRKLSRALERKTQVDVVVNPYTEVDPADLDGETFMSLVNDAVPSSVWEPKMRRDQVRYIAP